MTSEKQVAANGENARGSTWGGTFNRSPPKADEGCGCLATSTHKLRLKVPPDTFGTFLTYWWRHLVKAKENER